MTMEELVRNLTRTGVLKSPCIIEAFLNVDRKDFLPAGMERMAYFDEALPIGYGQTISQPYTVAFMLELLAPEVGDRIMDVGYGSGWTSVVLAHIVREEGRIYAFERVRELCEFGEENVKKYPEYEKRIEFFCKDATPGLPQEARPEGGFDGIIVAAELSEVPNAWREQLKRGGRLVYPKANSIFQEKKGNADSFDVREYHGFVFVPFIPDEDAS